MLLIKTLRSAYHYMLLLLYCPYELFALCQQLLFFRCLLSLCVSLIFIIIIILRFYPACASWSILRLLVYCSATTDCGYSIAKFFPDFVGDFFEYDDTFLIEEHVLGVFVDYRMDCLVVSPKLLQISVCQVLNWVDGQTDVYARLIRLSQNATLAIWCALFVYVCKFVLYKCL